MATLFYQLVACSQSQGDISKKIDDIFQNQNVSSVFEEIDFIDFLNFVYLNSSNNEIKKTGSSSSPFSKNTKKDSFKDQEENFRTLASSLFVKKQSLILIPIPLAYTVVNKADASREKALKDDMKSLKNILVMILPYEFYNAHLSTLSINNNNGQLFKEARAALINLIITVKVKNNITELDDIKDSLKRVLEEWLQTKVSAKNQQKIDDSSLNSIISDAKTLAVEWRSLELMKDTKDLQEENVKLAQNLQASEEEKTRLAEELQKASELKTHITTLESSKSALESELQTEKQKAKEAANTANTSLSELKTRITTLESNKSALEAELQTEKQKAKEEEKTRLAEKLQTAEEKIKSLNINILQSYRERKTVLTQEKMALLQEYEARRRKTVQAAVTLFIMFIIFTAIFIALFFTGYLAPVIGASWASVSVIAAVGAVVTIGIFCLAVASGVSSVAATCLIGSKFKSTETSTDKELQKLQKLQKHEDRQRNINTAVIYIFSAVCLAALLTTAVLAGLCIGGIITVATFPPIIYLVSGVIAIAVTAAAVSITSLCVRGQKSQTLLDNDDQKPQTTPQTKIHNDSPEQNESGQNNSEQFKSSISRTKSLPNINENKLDLHNLKDAKVFLEKLDQNFPSKYA